MTPPRRRLWVNGSLLLLAGLSLLAVRFTATGSPQRGQRDAGFLFNDFASEDLTRLKLQASAERLTLIQSREQAGGSRWLATDASGRHLLEHRVLQRIEALRDARVLRSLGASVQPATLGLTTPVASLEFALGEQQQTLSLGQLAPSPVGARYAALQRKGAPIEYLLLAPQTSRALASAPGELLDARLLPFPRNTLAAIHWQQGATNLALSREPSTGRMYLGSAPRRRLERAFSDRLTRGLGELELLSATSASAEGRSKTSAAPEGLPFRLELLSNEQNAPSLQLAVAGVCSSSPQLWRAKVTAPLRGESCVEPSLFAPLTAGASKLVDRTAFWLHLDEVFSFRVQSEQRALEFQREGTAFKLNQATNSTLPLATGNGVLADLLSIQGTLVPDAPPSFSVEYRIKLRSVVVGTEDSFEELVELGVATKDGGRLLRRADDGTVLTLDPFDAARLLLTAEQLATPLALTEGLGELVRVELLQGNARESLEVGSSGELTLKSADGLTLNRGQGEKLVEELTALSALRALSPELKLPAPSSQLRLRLELRSAEGARHQVTLLVEFDAQGRHLAHLTNPDRAVLLQPPLVELLRHPLGR